MLTPTQIDKLQHLLGDDFLLKTIEQVFDETLDANMPQIHILDSNKRIGERYRSYDQAKGLIRTAFLDLISYKKELEIEEKSFNKAK